VRVACLWVYRYAGEADGVFSKAISVFSFLTKLSRPPEEGDRERRFGNWSLSLCEVGLWCWRGEGTSEDWGSRYG
jgi:hypothetical protein